MRIVHYAYPNTRRLGLSDFADCSPWTGLDTEIARLLGAATTESFPVDFSEDKDNAYVRAELPGVTREALSVELLENTLTIQGSRKRLDSEQSLSLSRSIRIPGEVQADKVSARHENGVLTVTLPKKEEIKPLKIAVS